MSTSWTLTREQIATKALRKCSAIGAGQTPDADDLAIAIEALDAILKELPLHGFAWPKTVAGSATLTLTAAVGFVALPTDYYGNPLVNLVVSGKEKPLPLIPLDQWNAIAEKTLAGTYPTLGYIDNFDKLNVWPVQTSGMTAKLSYQQMISDTAAQTATGLDSAWLRGLVYGVALEINDEFIAKDPVTLQRWAAIWTQARALAIANQTYPPVDCMSTKD